MQPRGPLIDPDWRKARIAARILLRKERGRLTARDRRLARRLAADSGVTNRLVDQALHSLRARLGNGRSILEIID